MDAAPRRPRLLIAAAVLLSGCGACEPDPPARGPADRALDYLDATRDELGLDVVLSIRIYAAATGDERAAAIAARRRAGLSAGEVGRYGALLDASPRPYPAATLDADAVDAAVVGDDDTDDDRVRTCPEAMLACEVDDACRQFAETDGRGGYFLTHQAVWLAFARWLECAPGVDVEARRRAIGTALAAEARAHGAVDGDLAIERLALLGELGFTAELTPERMAELAASQQPAGCFPVDPQVRCHPHPTGLALWAMARAPR